jgi:hypothetical protein
MQKLHRAKGGRSPTIHCMPPNVPWPVSPFAPPPSPALELGVFFLYVNDIQENMRQHDMLARGNLKVLVSLVPLNKLMVGT